MRHLTSNQKHCVSSLKLHSSLVVRVETHQTNTYYTYENQWDKPRILGSGVFKFDRL